ncbi:discoidin domain-containing protein [Paenibacillus tarimensis]
MQRDTAFRIINLWRRLLAAVVAVSMVAAILIPIGAASAADDGAIASTENQVEIHETISSNGFTHPGVGLTKPILETIREQVQAQKEPWYSYFRSMTGSGFASKTAKPRNQSSSDPTKPDSDRFDSQGFQQRFINDALLTYTQALMYVITGDETYRANAMHTIRIWSQMDPTKYAYYSDAHIHTGVPLNWMVTGAEILRYTSSETPELQWTDQDTAAFSNNLITPVIETFQHTNYRFMNQHTYPLLGAMAGYIFTDNRERYNEAVEWFTVNKTARDQGFNGSVSRLFRLVDRNDLTGEPAEPRVQLVEMGRDQAHAGGDVTNAAIISRMMLAQGTKVDPVEGTVSTNADAVGPYEFLNDRILAAADYYLQFMLGYDTPWTPVAYAISPDGTIRDTYNYISNSYRGRLNGLNFWDMYYYYTYVKGENIREKAPHFYEAFTKRVPFNWENRDGGGDFWLYMPKEAESEGTKYHPKVSANRQWLEVEDRYTKFDNNAVTMQEGDTSFVRLHATETGTKIAYINSGYSSGTFGLKFRTNGVATLNMLFSSWTLPDTKGQWKYMVMSGWMSDMAYFTVTGSDGTTVDMDHIYANPGTQLTPPVFNAGNSDLEVFTYAGAPLHLDFSATDESSTDVVAYELQHNPEGSAIDADTGAFSWTPTQADTAVFVVAASDGNTVTTKDVTIVVADDRASAVQAVIAQYDPNAIYVSASLAHYQTVYDETVNLIDVASDEAFLQQLATLRSVTESLELVTPLRRDGSIHYSDKVYWSSWGSRIVQMDDLNVETGGWYGLALEYPWNPHHIVDFGPDYKVSATEFGLQSNIFPDRLANSTVYGSNDRETWTRLTPGVTRMTQEYQILDVDPAYHNEKYRFIKLQMIKSLPDVLYGVARNFLELREFRIYGQRYEIDNKLESVSIGSDQSLRNRVGTGDTIKLTINAREAINNVRVKIQGQDVDVSTSDNINWTAELPVTAAVPTGEVKFVINYKHQDGTDGDPAYFTTDSTRLFIVDESDLIRDVASIANLIDPSTTGGRPNAEVTLQQVNRLFDGDINTAAEFRNGDTGSGAYITFDFKEGGQVTLTSVELLAANNVAGRLNGAVVQGSNDNATWTNLTPAAGGTPEWQTLPVSSQESYRYIRIFNWDRWYGNMAEVRFHGTVTSLSKIESASLSSDQSIRNRIVPGDTVKLTIKAKEAIHDAKVVIQGQEATVSTQDNINFTALATLPQGAAEGPVAFTINYKEQDGTDGFPVTMTTDNSSLFLVDESDVIRDVASIANLIDPSTSLNRPNASVTLQQVNNLFDSNSNTASDFRNGSNGAGGYITFDFKEGAQVTLTSVELLAANNVAGRLNGTVVQGSNDNTTWTDLTPAAAGTSRWQTLPVSSQESYRYIRIWNWRSWYGNMAEVRFHGTVTSNNKIESASLSSDQSIRNRIVPGDTVKLTIKAKEAIHDAKVVIQGKEATVSTQDNINFTAVATMPQDATAGPVTFKMDYEKQDGTDGFPVSTTTDNSALFLVDESDLIRDVPGITHLIDPSTSLNRPNASVTLQQVNNLFDSNRNTASDFRNGSNGAGGYITFDFKEGNQVTLTNVELLAANNVAHRITGTVVQGSNDNVTWTTLTPEAASTVEWQSLAVGSQEPYRYIRVWNWRSWFGNMAELRLHGEVKAADATPPVTTDDAPKGWVNKDTKVTLQAIDAESGVAATYYTVNGGEQQTGNEVVFTAEGEHTLVYWSVDGAGNVEAAHSVVVAIDKTAPAVAALSADHTGPTNSDVTIMISFPDDAAWKEYKVGESGEWTAYTAPVIVSDNVTVYARGTDEAGNVSDVSSYAVTNIDKIGPVSIASISPAEANGRSGWYTSDVTVTMDVYDNLSGVAATYYTLNGGEVQTGASVSLTEDGIYTLEYWSVDNAGNAEEAHTIVVQIDKTAPELNVVLDKTELWPPNHKLVTITAAVNGSDNMSGIESIVLTSITSSEPDEGTGAEDVPNDIQNAETGTLDTSYDLRTERAEEGAGRIYTITYTATDKAGNTAVVTVSVTVAHNISK